MFFVRFLLIIRLSFSYCANFGPIPRSSIWFLLRVLSNISRRWFERIRSCIRYIHQSRDLSNMSEEAWHWLLFKVFVDDMSHRHACLFERVYFEVVQIRSIMDRHMSSLLGSDSSEAQILLRDSKRFLWKKWFNAEDGCLLIPIGKGNTHIREQDL